MINYKDEILDYLSKERESLKEVIRPIQIRRNKMYQESTTSEWDEINESYNTAIFIQLYDELSKKMKVPFEDLYCELEVMKLSEFFEPSN